jgi:hypothetical protein
VLALHPPSPCFFYLTGFPSGVQIVGGHPIATPTTCLGFPPICTVVYCFSSVRARQSPTSSRSRPESADLPISSRSNAVKAPRHSLAERKAFVQMHTVLTAALDPSADGSFPIDAWGIPRPVPAPSCESRLRSPMNSFSTFFWTTSSFFGDREYGKRKSARALRVRMAAKQVNVAATMHRDPRHQPTYPADLNNQ